MDDKERWAILDEAVRRDSWIMFDNLGISVDRSNLPSVEQFDQAFRSVYTNSKIQRLWMRLVPSERRRRYDALSMWRIALDAEYRRELYRQVDELIDELGTATNDT